MHQLVVCLGYLIVSLGALASSQRRDFAILSALGWPPWHHMRLFLTQALLFAIGGGALGLGAALLLIWLLDAIPIWTIVLWTVPAMLILSVLGALYPLWQIWHIQPAEILRADSFIAPKRSLLAGSRAWSLFAPISTLVIRNLTRSRSRTFITFISLFLSAFVLALMFTSILALRQTLTGTLLGNFVLLQTAAPQLAGCVFAVLLTFLSIADLLLLQVRERQKELGLLQAIGWRPRQVQRLFVQEGLILAGVGALSGVLAAQGVLALQHTSQTFISALLVALGIMLLLILVAAIATLPAVRVANRMPVAEILRAE